MATPPKTTGPSTTESTCPVQSTALSTTGLSLYGPVSTVLIEKLCCGTNARQLFIELGLSPELLRAGAFQFQVKDRPEALLEISVGHYMDIKDLEYIVNSAVLIENGDRLVLFSPKSTLGAVDDFRLVMDGQSIQPGKSISEPELIEWNGGSSKTTNTQLDAEGIGLINIKVLEYDRAEVTVRQPVVHAGQETWFVSEIICSNPQVSTPRGLAAGMTYSEVTNLIGTGELIISIDTFSDPKWLSISKWDSNDGELDYTSMELEFNQGILSTIKITFLDP